MVKLQRPEAGKLHGGPKKNKNLAKRGPKPLKGTKKPKLRSIKNQIRGLERLLKKGGMDPRAQAQKQRELEQLRELQAARARSEVERKYAVRYHKVRFFERVKVERAIHKLQTQIAESEAAGSAGSAMQQRLQQLQQDLLYIKHFPKGEKYVSLLRNSDDPAAQARLESERARLRQLVALQLQEAAAIAEADEGRSLAVHAPGAAAVGGVARDGMDGDDFMLGTDSGDDEGDDGMADGGSDDEAAAAALAAARKQKHKQAEQQQRPSKIPKLQQKLEQQDSGKKRPSVMAPSAPPAKRVHQQQPPVALPTAADFASDDDFFLSEDDGDDAGQAAADEAAAGPAVVVEPANGDHRAAAAGAKPASKQGHGAVQGVDTKQKLSKDQQQHAGTNKQDKHGNMPRQQGVHDKAAGKGKGLGQLHVHADAHADERPRHKSPASKQRHGAGGDTMRAGISTADKGKQPGGQKPQHRSFRQPGQKSKHDGSKPKKDDAQKQPLRTRAEGGRKRRNPKNR